MSRSLVLALLLALAGCRERAEEPAPKPAVAAAPAVPSALVPPPLVPPPLVPKVVAASYEAMGTAVEMKVWTDREVAARAAMDDAHAEIKRLQALMTTWSDTSEISKVNAAAGSAAVPVSDEMVEVLEGAKRIYEESGGVFDITFYAFKGLWRFDHDQVNEVPSDAAIKARLPLVDGKQLFVDAKAKTARLGKKGMLINVGGIAKGYAVDRAAAVLAKHGFTDVVVQAGGDLLVKGRKGEAAWRVGIRDPRGPDGDFFAVAPIQNAAFSTAGDYERGFVKDGVRYHHILDPRTGKPATACRSVTILAPDALTADEIDDAIFILGPEKGLELLAKHPGAGAVIVDKDNRVHVSKNLEGVVEIVHPPTPGI